MTVAEKDAPQDRSAMALFRPAKVFFPCPQCGLQRYEPDADDGD